MVQAEAYTYMHFVVLVDVSNVLDDIRIRHVLVGLLARERQYLPQGDGKGPNVGLGAEFGLQLGVLFAMYMCNAQKATFVLFNKHNPQAFPPALPLLATVAPRAMPEL